MPRARYGDKRNYKEDILSPCSKCEKLTKIIRVSRANWRCEVCNHNKTLSDVYYLEAVNE